MSTIVREPATESVALSGPQPRCGIRRDRRQTGSPASPNLDGKRIGLYWNVKAGGDLALERTEVLLKKRYPKATLRHHCGTVGMVMRHVTPARGRSHLQRS